MPSPSIDSSDYQFEAKSVVKWLRDLPLKHVVWCPIPGLATKQVALVATNMCVLDNMNGIVQSSLPRSLTIYSNKSKPHLLLSDQHHVGFCSRRSIVPSWELSLGPSAVQMVAVPFSHLAAICLDF